MSYVVHFHADGGMCCDEDGRRWVADRTVAEGLAEILRREPGHNCGPASVRIEEVAEPVNSEGFFSIQGPDEPPYRAGWVAEVARYCRRHRVV